MLQPSNSFMIPLYTGYRMGVEQQCSRSVVVLSKSETIMYN
uniref:Uncharacterized protein n=1 Tax=uncultured marine crenarchaeote HF4000_ANIW133O4 TaxID=455574 RepID=B3T4F1_9ARCH|nr:hypothetical protein ALOHA_HF4000ANIW133O4ctg2g39 [uncultured marine crenarchaeote HF4000_ANIW133O4]